MNRDVPPTSGPLGIVFQVNQSSSYFDGGGGGGGSNFQAASISSLTVSSINGVAPGGGGSYPFVSSIGTVPDPISASYVGSGNGGPFTQVITFQPLHAYSLSWQCVTSNVGDTNGNETLVVGSGLAVSGGAYYSPPAVLTGANTQDGTLLTGNLNILPASSAWSTSIGVSFRSPNNPSTITSYFTTGLTDRGYNVTLTDFGPVA